MSEEAHEAQRRSVSLRSETRSQIAKIAERKGLNANQVIEKSVAFFARYVAEEAEGKQFVWEQADKKRAVEVW